MPLVPAKRPPEISTPPKAVGPRIKPVLSFAEGSGATVGGHVGELPDMYKTGLPGRDDKADIAQNTICHQIDPIMRSKWKSVFVTIIVLVALGDIALAVTVQGS